METREELTAMRAELVERLATETYRISAYNDEKLAKVANIKAAIDAIDYVLEHDIQVPPSGDPSLMIF